MSSTDQATADLSPYAMRTVLLVDDQPEVLQLSRLLLDGHEGLRVIGEAASGEEALALVPDLRPDLVVLDVQMPGLNGFETARRLLRGHPAVPVVITSADDDPQYERLAREAGARGYIAKKRLSALAVRELLESTTSR